MTKLKLILLTILLSLLLCSGAWGETFYISDAGAGTKTGLSYENRAAKTFIDADHGANFANPKQANKIGPGDTVYLCGIINPQCTGTNWHPRFTVAVSGLSGNQIIFRGDYPGDAGSIRNTYIYPSGSWTDETGGIYSQVFNPQWVIEDGTYITHAASEVALPDGQWFYKSGDGKTYYNPTGATLPSDHIVEASNSIELYLSSKSYLTIMNLTFLDGSTGIYSDSATVNCTSIIISGCSFINCFRAVNSRTGVGYSQSYNTYSNNTFICCGQGFLNSAGGTTGTFDHVSILNNIMTNHGLTPIGQPWVQSAAIEHDGLSFQNPNNCTVEDNSISGQPLGAIVVWENVAGSCKGNVVRRNYLSGGSLSISGINFCSDSNSDTCQNNTIDHNILVNFYQGASLYTPAIKVGSNDSTNSNFVVNNTIHNCYRSLCTHTAVSGWSFKNNISLSPTSIHWSQQDATPGITSDYNWYYPDGATLFQDSATGNTTFVGWKTNTSQDAHSGLSDPLFKSATDFHLTAQSPLAVRKGGYDWVTGTPNVTGFGGTPVTNGAGVLIRPYLSMGAYQWVPASNIGQQFKVLMDRMRN